MFIRFVVGGDSEPQWILTGIITEARLLRDKGGLDQYQISGWRKHMPGSTPKPPILMACLRINSSIIRVGKVAPFYENDFRRWSKRKRTRSKVAVCRNNEVAVLFRVVPDVFIGALLKTYVTDVYGGRKQVAEPRKKLRREILIKEEPHRTICFRPISAAY